eukprot:789057-Amphidinium_carterae.1
MEVGLGIHGEPGASKESIQPSSKVVEKILEGILAGSIPSRSTLRDQLAGTRLKAEATNGYACLINNLGGVPPQECRSCNDKMLSRQAGCGSSGEMATGDNVAATKCKCEATNGSLFYKVLSHSLSRVVLFCEEMSIVTADLMKSAHAGAATPGWDQTLTQICFKLKIHASDRAS